jgi:transposase
MEPLCLGKPGDPGRSGKDNRLFVEAVLWIVRTGSPWRDLPPAFGHWNSVDTRFRDWVRAEVWKRLFEGVSDEPDMEYAMADATIVRVHRHGQGAKGGLRARPWVAPKAGSRPRSLRSPTRWAEAVKVPLAKPVEYGRREPRPLRSPARPAPRHRWLGSSDPGHRVWRADRRQGLRCQLDHQRAERARRQDRHLADAAAHGTARERWFGFRGHRFGFYRWIVPPFSSPDARSGGVNAGRAVGRPE